MSRKRIFVTVALLVVLGGAAATAWMILRGANGESRSESAVRYHCPMHPTMVSDRPGECPICHMAMVPVDEGAAPADDAPAAREMVEGQPPASGVAGLATVRIPTQKQQLIGVKTALVTLKDSAFVAPSEAASQRQSLVNQYVSAFRHVEVGALDKAASGLRYLASSVSTRVTTDAQTDIKKLVDAQLEKLA